MTNQRPPDRPFGAEDQTNPRSGTTSGTGPGVAVGGAQSGPVSGSSNARRSFDRVFRLVGAPLLALYLFTGAVSGLRQQSLELDRAEINCDYRAALIDDRLTALRTYRVSSAFHSSHLHSLNSLIEQTLAACAQPQSNISPRILGLQQELQRWEKAQRELHDAPQAAKLGN